MRLILLGMSSPSADRGEARPVRWSPPPDLQLAFEAGVIAPDLPERPSATAAQVRRGVWRAYGDVVVMHNGPLDNDQQEWVAVLRAGEGAVLAAASAMRRGGTKMDTPPRPQVLIPWSRTAPSLPDTDVRRTRVLTGQDVHPTRQPPQLRLARARSTPPASSGARTTYARCCAPPFSSGAFASPNCVRWYCGWVPSPDEASCSEPWTTSSSVRTASMSCASPAA